MVTKGSKLSKNANIQPGFEGKRKFLISSFGDTFLTLFQKVNIKVFPFLLVKYIYVGKRAVKAFYVFMYGRRQNVIIKASH